MLYNSLRQQSISDAFSGQITFLGKRMSSRGIPHLKGGRPALNAAPHCICLCFNATHTHSYVHCLIWRCSKRSIPDIQEKNLRMRALRGFRCKGSSWLLLMPWFCNTYNMYIWGCHTEYIVPFSVFYFIWTLDVVSTVCIQTEVILVQSHRSRFKQKGRTWMQFQMLDVKTKLLMVFSELPLLGMCFCVWNHHRIIE